MRYVLLIDSDGNVVLGDVDSKARVSVSEPVEPGGGARAATAVWSAAGQWTAWSVDYGGPDGVHEIRLHDEATDSTRVLAASLTAFYLCPSPCGRYLSHLSPGPLGLELAVSDVATGELHLIERGQPLFWAWSADASGLAVHVERRVLIASLGDASPSLLSEHAGQFAVPCWMPGGSVVFAADGRIVCGGADGAITTLAERVGSGRFALDPEGRRLAMADQFEDRQSLVVLDLLTGGEERITTDETVAFFWSPEGRRLAALVLASATELRWIVFDGAETVQLKPFRPGRAWLTTVLPFFEQYAQSHAVWSSDGKQLVAVSLGDDDRPGAFIQGVESPFIVDRLPDAELAWWADE